MNTEPYYYIDMQGQRQGPVTFGELQNIALLPETLVWHAGTKQWLPARRFRALAPLVNAEAPPAPPPPDSTLNEAGRSVFFRPDRFVRSVIRYTLLIHPIFWIIQRIIFFSGFPERNIIPNATLAFLFSTGLLLLSFLMLLGLATCGLLLRAGHRLGRPVTLWVIGIHITGLLLLVILRTILFFSDTTSLALGWVVLPIIPLVCEVTILIGLLVRPVPAILIHGTEQRNSLPWGLLIPSGTAACLALFVNLVATIRPIINQSSSPASQQQATAAQMDLVHSISQPEDELRLSDEQPAELIEDNQVIPDIIPSPFSKWSTVESIVSGTGMMAMPMQNAKGFIGIAGADDDLLTIVARGPEPTHINYFLVSTRILPSPSQLNELRLKQAATLLQQVADVSEMEFIAYSSSVVAGTTPERLRRNGWTVEFFDMTRMGRVDVGPGKAVIVQIATDDAERLF